MENENSLIETIEGVKSLLTQLPTFPHSHLVIPKFNIIGFGGGQAGIDLLKLAVEGLDFSKVIESANLDTKIKRQEKELKDLEKKHTNLSTIIGDKSGNNEGSIAHTILINLNNEIKELIKKRDDLIEVNKLKEDQYTAKNIAHEDLENAWKAKFERKKFEDKETYEKEKKELFEFLDKEIKEVNSKISDANKVAELKISNAENEVRNKVKLINQFSDFLAETNSNMLLYSIVIGLIVVIAGIAVYLSIPDLLACFKSYDKFVTILGAKATTWQIINLAFGLLIVKLPWALVLSAVFTGMYKLLKGLLFTYEKINQDKRNMSAIYAVSGNIAQSLNEYGLAISNDFEWEDSPEEDSDDILIKISSENLDKKRESLKWNQIMKYFERMQSYKEEPEKDDDDKTKFESLINLAGKAIDKIPQFPKI